MFTLKSIILYYSYSGNTRKIAQMLQEQLGGDLAEIKTVAPYEGGYNAVVEQGRREIEQGYEPAIEPLTVAIAHYDTILLGTPVWWYTFAPPVKTVLSAFDWSGKTVYPFATNGGGIGHTLADIAQSCAGATVKPGLNVRFDEAALRTPMKEIEKWLQQIR